MAPTSPRAQGAGGEPTISTAVRAEVDLTRVASGKQLTTGVWDIFVHLHSCGWSSVQRLAGVGDEATEQHVVQPYLTQYGNLSLKVTEPPVAPTSSQPAPEPPAAPPAKPAPQAPEAPGTKPLGLAVTGWLLRVTPVRTRRIAKAVLLRVNGRRR
ncbi:MAG: hypothetical protein LC798_02325 [Chloroflexi bacterium]|nr:hypothetical protein [Chloroflexota bacterium]